MKFCWVTINVKDLAGSIAFYQDIVGLKLNRRFNAGPDMELAFLGEGDTQVELICNRNRQEIDVGKDISLGFIVPSVAQFMEFLRSKGLPLHSGPFQPNPAIKFIYVQDPDGLKIQFVERLVSRPETD